MSKRILTPCQQIERSIIKTYHKKLWTPFIKAIKQYELLKEGDNIAVCISGGKDSFLLAKLFQQLQKHSDFKFEVQYITMDPGYNEWNMQKVIENAKLLEIPLQVFKSDIFDIVSTAGGNPCYLCARMRRGSLYEGARKAGCNKIALGHHFNDVVETTLLGMFYGGQFQTMMPKLHSTNFKGMELIRPLYQIHEEDIIAWRNYNNLDFILCGCRFTENIVESGDSGGSKRQEIKMLLQDLKDINKDVEKNIFSALHKVNFEQTIQYIKGGETHSFLEWYDKF
jgi:tRNA(Ile)-lysidine synthase TilS/MesJ